MIYQAYEAQKTAFDVMRPFASVMATTMRLPWPSLIPRTTSLYAAKLDVFADLHVGEKRPPFHIKPVDVGNRLVAVEEEVVAATPFVSLLHFKKDLDRPQAARACGCADVGPFRDPAARHGADAAHRP